MDKDTLLTNLDKIHTTELGILRIKNNLKIDVKDVIDYIKDKILKADSIVYKNGKNFYCMIDDIIITINSFNYSVITAHIKY